MRILYHSLDATGRTSQPPAVGADPGGTPPAKGWPVIAWAHGTSGVARLCAPSAMKDVYYGDEGSCPWSPPGSPWSPPTITDSAPKGRISTSTRRASPRCRLFDSGGARGRASLGAKWVADGHSQGGLAAWGVAEAEHDLKDPNYLGAVSVAGVAREADFFSHLSNTPGVGFYLAFMAAGIHARYPEFKPHDLLSDSVLEHYADVTTKGCFYYGYATYAGLPDRHAAAARTGRKASRSTDSSRAMPWATRPSAVRCSSSPARRIRPCPSRRCAKRSRRCAPRSRPVTFRSYPGLDHDPTMEKSTPDQLKWIRSRFAGKPAASNCAADGA